MPRKKIHASIGRDVHEAVAAKATELEIPYSRALDALVRRALGMTLPVDKSRQLLDEPQSAA